jgi:hypothetical protein
MQLSRMVHVGVEESYKGRVVASVCCYMLSLVHRASLVLISETSAMLDK